MKYKILIPIALVISAAIGYFELAPKPAICQNIYSSHAYSPWKSTGQVSQAFIGKARMLMQRKCFRCGHIDCKESD